MDRRKVIVQLGSLLLILPASRVLTGCDDSDNGVDGGTGGDGGGGGQDAGGGTDAGTDAGTTGPLTFTSTTVDAHNHTFTIQATELVNPPTGGINRATSTADAHQHTVELTVADLTTIEAGGTVTKDTSLVESHTHQFTFRKS